MFWFEGIWTLGLCIRKATEYFKWSLTGHISRILKDSSAEGYMSCGGLTQEVSEEKNFSILRRDCFCNMLMKNVTNFYPI